MAEAAPAIDLHHIHIVNVIEEPVPQETDGESALSEDDQTRHPDDDSKTTSVNSDLEKNNQESIFVRV